MSFYFNDFTRGEPYQSISILLTFSLEKQLQIILSVTSVFEIRMKLAFMWTLNNVFFHFFL